MAGGIGAIPAVVVCVWGAARGWRITVRYFTDGAILGSRAFVEEAFLRHRGHFSMKRDVGAKPMRGGDWGDLFTARQLRVDVVGFPAPA